MLDKFCWKNCFQNLQKEADFGEDHSGSQEYAQSFEDSTSQGGRKNWADSIDEEEELELKKSVWENTSRKIKADRLESTDEELLDKFKGFDLGKSGSYADSGKKQKNKSNEDKPQNLRDLRDYKEYSSKYSDKQQYDDKHSARKQIYEDYHSGDDGYSKRSTTRGSQFSSSDVGYQEFTRGGGYNRSSHSQQFRRSNYHVLTSRKSNVSETNIPEKEKTEFESKPKSEHSKRPDSNPWRLTKGVENARDEKRDANVQQRSNDTTFASEISDKHPGGIKMETAKVDEGSGDGICKDLEAAKGLDLESLRVSGSPPVQTVEHDVLASETWVSPDYKESFDDVVGKSEVVKKDGAAEVDSRSLKSEQEKETLLFDNQMKPMLESEHSSMDSSTTNKSMSHAVRQPTPNVWLSRQKQEQKKSEERSQPTKNVWSKNEPFQKSIYSRDFADHESKNSKELKESSSFGQSQQSANNSTISNTAPKKPPALMDMLIAKPPTSLLKESQLLSSDDLIDSDWNSTDNLSYPGRKPERRGGYSRTIRGAGNPRRRMQVDQQDHDVPKDGDRRRGHSYKYGDSGRKSRGLTRG